MVCFKPPNYIALVTFLGVDKFFWGIFWGGTYPFWAVVLRLRLPYPLACRTAVDISSQNVKARKTGVNVTLKSEPYLRGGVRASSRLL